MANLIAEMNAKARLGYTPHSQENQAFSDQAHLQARRDIYPLLFETPADRLEYIELPDRQKRDYEQGIDKTIAVLVPGLQGKLRFSVQERWRRIKYANHDDLSITECNRNSEKLGELYKMEAWLMLYGYYDASTSNFAKAIACWVPPLMAKIASRKIRWEAHPNPRTNQNVLYFKFDDLRNLPGVVAFWKDWTVEHENIQTTNKPA